MICFHRHAGGFKPLESHQFPALLQTFISPEASPGPQIPSRCRVHIRPQIRLTSWFLDIPPLFPQTTVHTTWIHSLA